MNPNVIRSRAKRSKYDQLPNEHDQGVNSSSPSASTVAGPLLNLERYRTGPTGPSLSQSGTTSSDRQLYGGMNFDHRKSSDHSKLEECTRGLELEKENSSPTTNVSVLLQKPIDNESPIKTTSGLLLTHRNTRVVPRKINGHQTVARTNRQFFSPIHHPSPSMDSALDYPLEEIDFLHPEEDTVCSSHVPSLYSGRPVNRLEVENCPGRSPETYSYATTTSRPRGGIPLHAFHNRHRYVHDRETHTDACSCFTEKRGNRVVLSYARLRWAALFVFIVAGSGIVCIAVHRSRSAKGTVRNKSAIKTSLQNFSTGQERQQQVMEFQPATSAEDSASVTAADTDALTPILYRKNLTETSTMQMHLSGSSVSAKNKRNKNSHSSSSHSVLNFIPHHVSGADDHHRGLSHLLEPFNEWIAHHKRNYGSEKERQHRFHIWAQNHINIQKKNERHGPCKLTGQPIFGSNHFQDLTDEEFQEQFLTGYTAVVHDAPEHYENTSVEKEEHLRRQRAGEPLVLQPRHPVHGVKRHPSVQKRFVEHWERQSTARATEETERKLTYGDGDSTAASKTWCSWSVCGTNPFCWMNCALDYLYNDGGTMVPSSMSESLECKYFSLANFLCCIDCLARLIFFVSCFLSTSSFSRRLEKHGCRNERTFTRKLWGLLGDYSS